VFTFFTVAAVTKFSSDGSILHNICYKNSSDCRTVHAAKPGFLG
jgi:hypothetical protein